jgi:hypothetical protein
MCRIPFETNVAQSESLSTNAFRAITKWAISQSSAPLNQQTPKNIEKDEREKAAPRHSA